VKKFTKKVRLYLKTSKSFDVEALAELQKLVIEGLTDDISFEIIVAPDLPNRIDWRRHSGEPPGPSVEARFLTNEIDGTEVWGGGNIGPSSNDKLIPASTVLNWIGHLGKELPRIIPEAERLQKHMLLVEDRWKHGSDEFVYKYCSWKVAKEHILAGTKTLRLNDVLSLNDPLEFERFSVNLYGGPGDDSFPPRYWNAIHQATKSGIRYFCCSQDIASDFNSTSGLLMRHAVRGFAHPSMWNHYGSQHEGVCLILKKSSLNKTIHRNLTGKGYVFSGPIRYVPNSASLEFYKNLFPIEKGMNEWTNEKLTDHARRIAVMRRSQLFFTKSQEWSVENEFRWAFIGDGEGPVDIPVNDTLAGIILGCDFDNKSHAEAEKLAYENGIPVRRVWWKNGFACPPWPLNAFENGETLAKWSEQAAIRRKNRQS